MVGHFNSVVYTSKDKENSHGAARDDADLDCTYLLAIIQLKNMKPQGLGLKMPNVCRPIRKHSANDKSHRISLGTNPGVSGV